MSLQEGMEKKKLKKMKATNSAAKCKVIFKGKPAMSLLLEGPVLRTQNQVFRLVGWCSNRCASTTVRMLQQGIVKGDVSVLVLTG